jgi:hypothetical protein
MYLTRHGNGYRFQRRIPAELTHSRHFAHQAQYRQGPCSKGRDNLPATGVEGGRREGG